VQTPTPTSPDAELLAYAELHCVSNFSFLRGASRPEELIDRAVALGYSALAITDECSLAGVVRARGRVQELAAEAREAGRPFGFRLIVGAEFALDDGFRLVVLVRDMASYSRLCRLITTCRRAAPKGEYAIDRKTLDQAGLDGCALLLVPPCLPPGRAALEPWFAWFAALSAAIGRSRGYR